MNAKVLLLGLLVALIATMTVHALNMDTVLANLDLYEFADEEFSAFDEDYGLQAGVYIVQSGDNLSAIASRHGCTVAQLVSINGIQNPNLIHVGQKITLCGGSPTPTPPAPSGGSVYVVQSGDNLSAIASRFGCTLQQLVSINGIQNPNLIQVGQRITLCGGSGPTPTPPSPSGSCTSMSEAGWSYISNNLFGVTGTHRSHINSILATAQANGVTSCQQVAYILATVRRETGGMTPVREAYWNSEEWRRNNFRYFPYYGRGYVQLTWQSNYARAGSILGMGNQLVNNPDLALDQSIAARILVIGMRDGWFTGVSLNTYINGSKCDYYNARRIVNGLDVAELIAGYARHFEAALRR